MRAMVPAPMMLMLLIACTCFPSGRNGLPERASRWVPACEDRLTGRRLVLLGEADLPALQGGVPEGGDDDELVAGPLGGLAELDVERLAGGGMTVPSGMVISPVKVPVALVTTVIQSPLPKWIGYGSLSTCMSGKMRSICCMAAACASRP